MTKVTSQVIDDINLKDALGQRYLSYAISTITSRSLPDARDGLKPVQRRVLYAMRQLHLAPTKPFKKAARVVGDVVGKFHPHGDSAIYESLVRLAQDFSLRYPLVEGQGNFGSIDGDNAAAMRYTEARLTDVALNLLDGIDEDTVDFNPTYDGLEVEPRVLPALFPNLLANGAVGIAVGMATNIPPHNVAELCQALVALIDKPTLSSADLMAYVKGPDFPTGGIIVDDAAMLVQVYSTGRGPIRVRARWQIEQLKGGAYQVIVTEIPYQVNKSRLIEKIADLLDEKKLPLLDDIQDESDENIRIVLRPRSRMVDPAVLMESLFRQTDLEARFSMNLNVLHEGIKPRVMNLQALLQAYLDHQWQVRTRQLSHQRTVMQARLNILDGLLIAYLNIDEVIALIREHDEPKPEMMQRWGLNEVQADAILNLRLRALRRLEEMEIRIEQQELTSALAEIEDTLQTPKKLWSLIKKSIQKLQKQYGLETPLGARRTTFETAPEIKAVPIEAVIEREAITLVITERSWARAFKGHTINAHEAKYKEGDAPKFVLKCFTTDKIILLTRSGKAFTLPLDKMTRSSRGTTFDPLTQYLEYAMDDALVEVVRYDNQTEGMILMVASDGRGFQTTLSGLVTQTRNGRQVMNMPDGAYARFILPMGTASHIAVVASNRRVLIFPAAQVPTLGRGRGNVLIRFKVGEISDLKFMDPSQGLTYTLKGKETVLKDLTLWLGNMGQPGRMAPQGFPHNNKFTQG